LDIDNHEEEGKILWRTKKSGPKRKDNACALNLRHPSSSHVVLVVEDDISTNSRAKHHKSFFFHNFIRYRMFLEKQHIPKLASEGMANYIK
jgi:hypothetical protein